MRRRVVVLEDDHLPAGAGRVRRERLRAVLTGDGDDEGSGGRRARRRGRGSTAGASAAGTCRDDACDDAYALDRSHESPFVRMRSSRAMAVPGEFRGIPSISRGHAYWPRKRLTAISDPPHTAPFRIADSRMLADRE